ATERAVYVPAALAGIGGALLARARRTVRPRSPLVLSALVAACGLLGVLDVVLPGERHALIGSLAPERVQGLSTALVAPLGLALVVVARRVAPRLRAVRRMVSGFCADADGRRRRRPALRMACAVALPPRSRSTRAADDEGPRARVGNGYARAVRAAR